MGKSTIMTLRLPGEVHRGVERLAARLGHKPAQIGARLIEEGLRRRDFPQIDLRESAAGRVAYLAGTRLAVYWVVQRVRGGMDPEQFAREHEVPAARVGAALAYAEAFPEEIQRDIEEAEANRRWVECQDAAWRSAHRGADKSKPPGKLKR
jgi:uncharacterized protein (DUF433 family)